jgi:hypothetical protein
VQAAHLDAGREEEAAAILAQVRGMLPALKVFFDFARPGVVFSHPPATAFRLIDILHHTKLQNIGQVLACLEAINEAFVRLRGNASVRSCCFDNEGHCFVAPQTQASIAALWQDVIAAQRATTGAAPASRIAPAA